ncbi:hypothetical protein BESB_030830 [Besnoitia besnoiti]|uniref:Uncharacterized protein n=1 Tax=Besnoitia besnoiti TaxID=94643 RepID=A0A2A9LZQ4_BESBE|nr:hypothetical protein BESB_030830 [Besnoitia besnoiti]PFH31209.1 hypothetical protein BESB_030830 [Besnoitia besnoiti]
MDTQWRRTAPLSHAAAAAFLCFVALGLGFIYGDASAEERPETPPPAGTQPSKTYIAARQVFSDGYELLEETPVYVKKTKLLFSFIEGISRVPPGAFLFETDSNSQFDPTLRVVIAYTPTQEAPISFTSVLSKEEGNPVVCGANPGRRCFAYLERGVLRPLRDREVVVVGRRSFLYEIISGAQGRFVAADLGALAQRPVGSFVTQQLLGRSLAVCQAPSPSLPADFPSLTAPEQVDPFSHFVFPRSSLPAGSALLPPMASPDDEFEVCTVDHGDLSGDGRHKMCLLRPRKAAQKAAAAGEPFLIAGGSLVCAKTSDSQSLLLLDQNIALQGDEATNTSTILAPVVYAGTDKQVSCDLGSKAHTVETLLSARMTDPAKPVTTKEDGSIQKDVVHHFSVAYVPSVSSNVLVEVPEPLLFEAETQKTTCSIGASLTVLQPHLLLKSDIPHKTKVMCEVANLPMFQKQGQILVISPSGAGEAAGDNNNKRILLPPGSILLARDDTMPPEIYKILVYDLWQGDDLRAVLKKAYYRRSEHEQPVPVYIELNESQMTAIGSYDSELKRFTQFEGLSPQRRDPALEREAPFFYASSYGLAVPIGMVVLKSGVGLSVRRVPEAAVFFEDLLKAPLDPQRQETLRERSPFSREAEDAVSRLHRLKGHFSRDKYAAHSKEIMRLLNSGLAAISSWQKDFDALFLSVYPRTQGTRLSDVQIRVHYLDASMTRMSVILRLPMRLYGFLSAGDLAPQVLRVLSLLLEVAENPANPNEGLLLGGGRFAVLTEAVRVVTNLLMDGYCNECTQDGLNDAPHQDVAEGRCGMCSANRIRDLVSLDLHDVQPSSTTLPTAGTWAKWNGDSFLVSLPPEDDKKIHRRYGVEFDYHTAIDYPPRLRSRFLHYAGSCIRSHLIEMVEPLIRGPGISASCPGLSPFASAVLSSLSFAQAAPLLEGSMLLLQHVVGACNVPHSSSAVEQCLDDDGDILGHRRMAAVQPLGRSRIFELMLELVTPVSSFKFLNALASGENRIRALPAGPLATAALALSHDAQAVLKDTGRNSPPLLSYVFGPRSPLGEVAAVVDQMTAQQGYLVVSTFFDAPVDFLEQIIAAKRKPARKPSGPEPHHAPILSVVDRTAMERLPNQQVSEFIGSCFINHPEICQEAYKILGWPLTRFPSNEQELQAFEQAFNEARVRLGREEMPEALRVLFLEALAQFDGKEPKMDAPTEAKLETETPLSVPPPAEDKSADGVKSMEDDGAQPLTSPAPETSPVRHEFTVFELPGVAADSARGPAQTSQRLAWPYVHKLITAKHGPSARMPSWVRTSASCPCTDPEIGEGCRMDSVKSTSNVLFRLSLLVPSAVERFIAKQQSKNSLEPEFAAFCASVGLFAASWQQQLVAAGYEEKGANLAHKTLASRLAQGDKYLLKTYSADGGSDHKQWWSRRKRFQKFQKHHLYRQCRSLMVEAGNVAYAPFKSQSFPAFSLYGGIANTLNTAFADRSRVVHGIAEWGTKVMRRHQSLLRRFSRAVTRRSAQAPAVGAVVAALHVSHLFKECFNTPGGLLLRTWYYMHIEGSPLVDEARRLPVIGSKLRDVAFGFMTGLGAQGQLFVPAFREISKVVTPAWEAENLFTTLAAYTPGTAVVSPAGRSFWPAQTKGKKKSKAASAAGGRLASTESLVDPEKIIGKGGSMPVASAQSVDSSFLSFGEDEQGEEDSSLTEDLEPADNEESQGAVPQEGGRIIASFRYNPRKFSNPARELMFVEVPVPVSAMERRVIASFSADQVLHFLQGKLESLHSQLVTKRGATSKSGFLSMMQLQGQAPRHEGGEQQEQCMSTGMAANLVGFLSMQLKKDLKREGGDTQSYLELGHRSLPNLSAGAYIAQALEANSADTVLAVQMPDVDDDSHLNMEDSALDFNRPITIGPI